MIRTLIFASLASLTLAGCDALPQDNRELTGAAIGAGAGLVGAAVFDANPVGR